MERILCLIIGYVFGLFQTGYLYGRLNGLDIRTKGSGNSGTTNALRVMGKKAGAIVLLGDLLKVILAVLVTSHLFNHGVIHDPAGELLALYTGIGAVLGHNFPFYLQFKGGKGIASAAAMIIMMDWRIFLVLVVVFAVTVVLTRYVSLGSILCAVSFIVLWFAMGGAGKLAISADSARFMESCVLVFCLASMVIWRHRANIARLRQGTENKLF